MKLLKILAIAILLFSVGCAEDEEPKPTRPDMGTGTDPETDPDPDPELPDPNEGLTKWNFNDVTDGWIGITEDHIKDGNLVLTQGPSGARKAVKTPVKTFGVGRYTWRVNVPTIEENAQFCMGFGLYNTEVPYQTDVSSKAYFLVGYGKSDLRTQKGATEDQVIAFISSAGQPLIEEQVAIETGWTDFEFIVALNEEDETKYTITWLINDEVVKVANMWYGPETLFELICETSSYGFTGDNVASQTHEVLFDYVSYDIREEPAKPTEPEVVDGVQTWNFDNLDYWTYAHQGTDLLPNQCEITDGILRIFTRAGSDDRKKVKTHDQKYTSGRYKWRVYVPQMGTGDRASIGAFLYSDDRHELDFEIGYGTSVLRAELGAEDDEMVVYTTTQANPHKSTKHLIKAEAWYDLEMDLELVGGNYMLRWYIDQSEVESVQLTYGNTTLFSIFCSVENLNFMGDHVTTQENYGKFDYVSYKFHR